MFTYIKVSTEKWTVKVNFKYQIYGQCFNIGTQCNLYNTIHKLHYALCAFELQYIQFSSIYLVNTSHFIFRRRNTFINR